VVTPWSQEPVERRAEGVGHRLVVARLDV